MDYIASASRHCALLFCCVIFMASADQKNISATVGESVTLPCRAPDNSIRAMLWSRPDLEPKYILLYRDKQIDPEEQHPSFKDRVDLQDRQMKDGDVSLMIRNVMIFDSGTYECQVFMKGPNQRKRTADYITIINLTVVPVKKNITAGETAVLSCQAPNTNSNPNTVVEWSRADLKPKYILLYRDKQFVPDDQHPSFKNRVDLQDRQMKDGDVSLILKDATTADAGIYEIRISPRTKRRKRANLDNNIICIISLSVDPPGQTGGHTEDGSVGLKVGLSVFGILVLVVGVVVGFVIFKNSKEQKNEASS